MSDNANNEPQTQSEHQTIAQFVKEHTTKYEQCDLQDEALWELFQEDFQGISADKLYQAGRRILGTFRRTLRHRGVWIDTNHHNARVAEAIVNIATCEDVPRWPEAELAFLIQEDEYQEYISKHLQRRFETIKKKLENNSVKLNPTLNTPTNSTPIVHSTIDLATQPEPGMVSKQPVNPSLGQAKEAIGSGLQNPTTYSENGRMMLPTSYKFNHPPTLPQNQLGSTRQDEGTREIANLMKTYKDDEKYGQAGDNFDQKLKIFINNCEMLNVPKSAYTKAFNVMLKGKARDFYLNDLLHRDLNYDGLYHEIRLRFEDKNYRRNALLRWDTRDMNAVIREHPDKSVSECFDILTNELQEISHSLIPTLQNDDFKLNKLVNACKPIPECQMASLHPPDHLGTFINDMKNAILTYESIHGKKQADTFLQSGVTYTTDRVYRSSKNSGIRTPSRSFTQNRRLPPPSGRHFSTPKRCFVCHQEGCWSSNHSAAEQRASKEKFRKKLRTTDFGRSLRHEPKRFESFATYFFDNYEGENEDFLFEEALKAAEEAFNSTNLNDDDNEEEDEAEGAAFFTTFGKLLDLEACELLNGLNTMAFNHATHTLLNSSQSQSKELNTLGSRYNSGTFQGICIDTGAAKISSVGWGQYQAYNAIHHITIDAKNPARVQFGKGAAASSIGTIRVHSPIGSIDFHVLESDTPFLLCLGDMDRLRVHFNNLTNLLHTPQGNYPIVRKFGHPFLCWEDAPANQSEPTYDCFLTEGELRRLHRRFGHPSVERLQRLLERAGHEVNKGILKHLTKFCHHCQKHGKSPGRFRFTLRDDVEFNYCIIVDIMYIEGNPVLHIVDEATRYQAGVWLKDMSAKHLWEMIQRCWINTYLGPPDWIVHDAGTNFKSREFKHNAALDGIMIKDVPIEAHNSIGIVERYHGLIRRAYEIIVKELPKLNKHSALQMAFKTVNDTAGPDGLIPTLLVYGAYPRMTQYDAPSPTTAQRGVALKKAMAEVKRLRAQKQINDALNTRNGPDTSILKDFPIGDLVMVWREATNSKPGFWDGPFPFLGVEGEDCVVGSPDTKFRSTKLKPYYGERDIPEQGSEDNMAEEDTPGNASATTHEPPRELQPIRTSERSKNPRRPRTQEQPEQPKQPPKSCPDRPRKVSPPEPPTNPGPPPATIIDPSSDTSPIQHPGVITLGEEIFYEEIFISFATDGPPDEALLYEQSRLQELNGLQERGVFEPVPIQHVPDGVTIFNSRFVDEIKNEGTSDAFEKSRLVVQGYNDIDKNLILTQAPTIQRASQRVILCLAAVLTGIGIYLRDITQAYTQSASDLVRDIYARPPREIDLWTNCLLRIIKPLYGIAESGNHWFNTYHKHHLEELHMKQSTYDPCLLSTNQGDPFGMIALQTDDSLIVASEAFATAEEEAIKKAGFATKDRQRLTIERPFQFNGPRVSLQADGSILLAQERHIKLINLIKPEPATLTSSRGIARPNVLTKDQYVAQRARGAYVATMTQPEASFDLSFAAQVTNPTKDDVKALNQRLQWQMDNPQRGLKFVKLDQESLRLIVFTDGSFANNRDYSSQIGYVIVLADKDQNANILHWSSTKCKRITRSVLASELYAMVNGFDMAASLKATIEGILHAPVPLITCTDSKSLYDCLVKLGTTNEKRLMIDVMSLRQSYERREIAEVKWIDGKSNPADAMTKSKPCAALRQLVDTNRIELNEMEWVERGDS